jgi:hypothetical protein
MRALWRLGEKALYMRWREKLDGRRGLGDQPDEAIDRRLVTLKGIIDGQQVRVSWMTRRESVTGQLPCHTPWHTKSLYKGVEPSAFRPQACGQ